MYRREQIMLEIEAQTKENEKVFGKLDPLDLEIFKTKEIMEQQRAAIEEKRKVKIQMEKKIKELQTEMLEDGMRKKKRNKDKEKDK